MRRSSGKSKKWRDWASEKTATQASPLGGQQCLKEGREKEGKNESKGRIKIVPPLPCKALRRAWKWTKAS